MSVFHNGRLRTMKANYTVKEGDLRVIRDEMTLVQLLLVAQNSDNMVKVNAQTTWQNKYFIYQHARVEPESRPRNVLRPLVYVRERELREFAEREGLPVIPENCPACFESPKERHRTKQLLAQQG